MCGYLWNLAFESSSAFHEARGNRHWCWSWQRVVVSCVLSFCRTGANIGGGRRAGCPVGRWVGRKAERPTWSRAADRGRRLQSRGDPAARHRALSLPPQRCTPNLHGRAYLRFRFKHATTARSPVALPGRIETQVATQSLKFYYSNIVYLVVKL